jgi:membrane associated rhomboid family serine protease
MTFILIAITCIVSFMGFSNPNLIEKFKFNAYKINREKQYYRFISHGFIHADMTHLLFNMISLYFFGKYAEMVFAPSIVYVLFYLLALVFASAPDYIRHKNNPYYNSLGASGAVSAVIFSMVLFEPWAIIYVYFIPLYFILYAILYLFYTVYMSKRNSDNIGHTAHLAGAIFGIIATLIYVPHSLAIFLENLVRLPFLN